MNKIFATVAAAVAVAFAANAANAAPLDLLKGYYAEGAIGTNNQENRSDSTQANVALGKDFGAVRAELAYSSTAPAKSTRLGKVSSGVVGANLYVEPVTIHGFTPFVGGGVGMGTFTGKGVKGEKNGVVFNAALGTSYALSDRVNLVAAYRYVIADDTKVQKAVGVVEDYRASTVTVGARYSF